MNACYQPLGIVEIRPATPADLAVIAELARLIWRAHYPSIISSAQVEYMLAQRYTPDAMTRAVATGELAYVLLTIDGEPRAFAAHGPAEAPDELKLQQLYVHPDSQGRGLGQRLLDHVESIARAQRKTALVLTVNKRNAGAIRTYERAGFTVRCSAVFDIGQGYVMDDFVMAKHLVRSS